MALRSFGCMALACALVTGCARERGDEGLDVIEPIFPSEVNGWSVDGPPESYDIESIFAYIDGHAEVYLAYGMKRCLSARYVRASGGKEMVVDLFEMASPTDAFGVFSHDQSGETVAVGQGGMFRHGWLSFWKGRWYASVYSTAADEGSREAVLGIGKAIADGIEPAGGVPALVGRLPVDGLEPDSICFLRSPQILNAHVFVGSDDPFGLDAGAEVVVGKYLMDEAVVHLVLVEYPGETAAEGAEARIRESEGEPAGRPEMIIGRRGSTVAAVVGPDSDQRGDELLIEVFGGEE